MYRKNVVCCATNFTQESANSPHSFCPFIRVNMAEEELTRCVVDHDSGMCKARSAGDEAPFVVNVSGKAGFASDDAPVAVPSSLSTLKSLSTRKRRRRCSCVHWLVPLGATRKVLASVFIVRYLLTQHVQPLASVFTSLVLLVNVKLRLLNCARDFFCPFILTNMDERGSGSSGMCKAGFCWWTMHLTLWCKAVFCW